MGGRKAKRSWVRRWWAKRWVRRSLIGLTVLFVGLPLLLTLVYRVVPPPGTPLMVIRLFEGEGLEKRWRRFDQISPHMAPAVIAAEDNLFCQHNGIDWGAVQTALDDHDRGKRLRGASTITMQTAKNLYLWPTRLFLRKVMEAYLVFYLEALWPKQRILEVYLNIVELGPGIYGVEAAAQHYFGVTAAKLTRRQAALIAAILPNPRERSAANPSASVRRKARTIETRIRQLGELLDCAKASP